MYHPILTNKKQPIIMFIKLSLIILILFSLLPYSLSSPPKANLPLTWWCNHTPNPKPCLSHLSSLPSPPPITTASEFFKLSLELAYNLTLQAHSHLRTLVNGRRSHKALLDCSDLHANTLFQLHRALNSAQHRSVDSQTWLSAALTNLDTCQKGFFDLKAEYAMVGQHVMSYNVSHLISNCLAINILKTNGMTSTVNAAATAKILRRKVAEISSGKLADIVVAKDGSGDYDNVQDAVNDVSNRRMAGNTNSIMVYVKEAVYNETVMVGSWVTDLTMIGDGKGKTIITGQRSVANGYTTFSSPTFSVFGDRFIASGITFRNTYGPGSQAVALLSGSDQSVYYQCSMEGYQDTLCVHTQRQFYRDCDIYGTIDFIFGNAAVVIQNSNIIVRKPNHGESNVITAQGRTDPNQNTGIVIQSSNIQAAPEFWGAHRKVKSYLGRPWMEYSRTVYLQNSIGSLIDPAGWLPFKGDFALDTLYYAEYGNIGLGATRRFRVKWKGYHVIARPSLVLNFTVENFIAGGAWLPEVGVPFDLRL